MSDMVANRLDDGSGKMDQGVVGLLGHDEPSLPWKRLSTSAAVRWIASSSATKSDIFLGRKKSMRKFYYAATTTQRPKGGCYFVWQVVPGDHGGYQELAFTAGKPNDDGMGQRECPSLPRLTS